MRSLLRAHFPSCGRRRQDAELLQSLIAGYKADLSGLYLSYPTSNLFDLRPLDFWRQMGGQRLDETIRKLGPLRKRKPLHLC